MDSPSPQKTPEPPDFFSDDERPPNIINDNKCCEDEDPCCPHVPRDPIPVPPVFPPSPEPSDQAPNPFCGAPSPRHKPALRSGNSSVSNSPKRKVDFQGSPNRLSTPKKSRNFSKRLQNSSSTSISQQKNVVNNNDSNSSDSPNHNKLSQASNNNNSVPLITSSPFLSPRRSRQVSVGEEIVDAFVRSCGSPICGSPKPRTGTVDANSSGSMESDNMDDMEEPEYEMDEVSYDPGCHIDDDDGCEVDEIIEVEEVLTLEIEESYDESCQVKNVKQSIKLGSVREEKDDEDAEKEVSVEKNPPSEGEMYSEEGQDVGLSSTNEDPKKDEDKEKSAEATEAGCVRRRRLLPEIPKNKKCK